MAEAALIASIFVGLLMLAMGSVLTRIDRAYDLWCSWILILCIAVGIISGLTISFRHG